MIFILRAGKETDNAMAIQTVGGSVKRGKDHDDQESWESQGWTGSVRHTGLRRSPAVLGVVIRTLFIIKQMSDAFHIEYILWRLLHAAKRRGNDSAKV